MRLSIVLILIISLTACNLTSATPTDDDIQITVASTSTAIPDTAIPATNTQSVSTNIPPTATSPASNVCNTPADWIPYTVNSGDTLFQIAQLSQSSVQELVDGNCLESADTISAGQLIYIPSEIAGLSPAFSPIYYWFPSDAPVNDESLEIGCGTYITPVASSSSVTNDASSNVRLALSALFNTTPSANSPYRNYWGDYDLTIDTVVVDSGGTTTIRLNGDFLLVGTCGDAEIIAQILLTVFAEPEVETAWITVGGMNLKQMSDMSGQTGPNAVFTRDDIPTLNN